MREIIVLTSGGGAINPYTSYFNEALRDCSCSVRRATTKRLIGTRYDVWHINWPEAAYRSDSFLATLIRAIKMLLVLVLVRLRRRTIVWTVHNLLPHDTKRRSLDVAFFAFLCHLVSGSLHLSESGRRMAFERYPQLQRKPSRVARHGTYGDEVARMPSRPVACATLGLDQGAKVFTFLGVVARYKCVDSLAVAFRDLRGDEFRLIVAGKAKDADLARQLHRILEADPRVELSLEEQSDEQVATILAATDVVVLPYGEFLNSGVLLLGLTADRVVLTRQTPVTEEIAEVAGREYVRLFTGTIGPKDLQEAAEDVHSAGLPRTRPQKPNLSEFSWAAMARASRDLYLETMRARRANITD